MIYSNVTEGTFKRRLNRFLAEVIIEGRTEQVHVRNTGRCKEILIGGTKVFLEKSDNSLRKTKYSIISACKGNMLINIDSQIPNTVVLESINDGKIEDFSNLIDIKKEKTYKNSRFDIYYKRDNGQEGFIEIKGVTLEKEGIAMFPDAPTKRGTKHLCEMIDAVKEGYEGNIFFLIQMDGIYDFRPNTEMDRKFSQALGIAEIQGVNILIYNCTVDRNSIIINKKAQYKR